MKVMLTYVMRFYINVNVKFHVLI